jgi:hypothetical protein
VGLAETWSTHAATAFGIMKRVKNDTTSKKRTPFRRRAASVADSATTSGRAPSSGKLDLDRFFKMVKSW